MAGAVLQIIDLVAKSLQAVDRALGQNSNQRMTEHGFKQTATVLVGKLAQFLQGGVANTALGRGDAAQERGIVIVVDQQAQPRAQVANLGAIKKALPP